MAAGEPEVVGRRVVMSYLVRMATPRVCSADVDGSGAIDGDDLGQFITDFYAAEPPAGADFDHDGRMTVDDVAAYVQALFGGCEEEGSGDAMLLRCENDREVQLMLTSFISERIEAEVATRLHVLTMPVAGIEIVR